MRFRKQVFNNTCETRIFVGEKLPEPLARPDGHLPRLAYPLVGAASNRSERGFAEIDDQTLRTAASTNKATPQIAAKAAKLTAKPMHTCTVMTLDYRDINRQTHRFSFLRNLFGMFP
jgi:hypothetical protein